MRPLKLVMTAFGPYANEQTLDFREATDAGLFGIYGTTGSGKSSIFSAMTFALFGEAAKEEQSIGSLRSDHADPNQLTEVSLVFELGERRYLVRRQPDQLRPKTRGEGDTNHAHTAWLFDVTDIDIDAIDPTGCGVVLAEKKVSQVGERVRDLLGYGAKQFRQIVLLPQGRFEKFLTSNSIERLAILRDLFDVSLYRRLTEAIKEKAAAAISEVRDGRHIVAQRLAAESFASSDELDDGIRAASEQKEALAAEASKKETELQRAEARVNAAEAVEARFVENEQAQAALAALQLQVPAIEDTRKRCRNAERARQANDVFLAIEEAQNALDEAVSAENDAAQSAIEAAQALTEAQAALERANAAEPDVVVKQRRVDELERFRKVLLGASDLSGEHAKALARRDELADLTQTASDSHAELVDHYDQSEARLRAAQGNENRRKELLGKRDRLSASLRDALAHTQAAKALNDAKVEVAGLADRVRTSTEAFQDAEAVARQCEDVFIAAQSSILAKHLVDGEPCPVCGAEEHPMPAQGEGDPHTLESSWNDARQATAVAANAMQAVQQEHAAAQGRVQERASRLEALDPPQIPADRLESEIASLDASLEELGPEIDVAELEVELVALKGKVEAAKNAANLARDNHHAAVTAEAVALRSYEDAIREVPELCRDDAVLCEEIEALEDQIALLKQAIDDAREDLQTALATNATAEASQRNAKQACVRANQAHARTREKFSTRLTELKLTEEEFEQYQADIPAIDELLEKLEQFAQDLRRSEGAFAQSSAAINGKVRPDLQGLRDACDQARSIAVEARQQAGAAEGRHVALVRLQQELSDELDRLRIIEERTGPLRALEEACSGRNEMNTTLETFAIGTLFDEVLDAANLRLEPMTAGRYRLERDIETTAGRAKRGLDIQVHDVQTGRARELSTLSGGETFIAALSLALGLSDVVEATHGGIRLDTVFVDEGFGSLDTDNDGGTLEIVLQVLQEVVGESRAVGLISHVALVQQAVPNGFAVSKGLAGSSVEPRAA